MKIHVAIECDSIEELGRVMRMPGVEVPPQVTAVETVAAEPAKAPAKKRGRPKKTAEKKGNGKDATAATAAATPVAGSVDEAAAAIEPGVKEEVEQLTNIDINDVRDAIAVYSSKHELAAARELLKKFGAGKVSDVKEADYAEFVKAASA